MVGYPICLVILVLLILAGFQVCSSHFSPFGSHSDRLYPGWRHSLWQSFHSSRWFAFMLVYFWAEMSELRSTLRANVRFSLVDGRTLPILRLVLSTFLASTLFWSSLLLRLTIDSSGWNFLWCFFPSISFRYASMTNFAVSYPGLAPLYCFHQSFLETIQPFRRAVCWFVRLDSHPFHWFVSESDCAPSHVCACLRFWPVRVWSCVEVGDWLLVTILDNSIPPSLSPYFGPIPWLALSDERKFCF